MKTYKIPLVPGPTSVPEDILEAYQTNYGSADLEDEFFLLYEDVQEKLQRILGTDNQMAIMTGEGMAALWGAMRSTVRPGDRVLAIGTGPFGYGIGSIAESVTGLVQYVRYEYDEIASAERVEEAIYGHDPHLVTLVHCETPAGTLNPVQELGEVMSQFDDKLFYVDAVSSAGGAPLAVDEWNVDLCLVGTQKCLSAPPDLAIISVSDRAWQRINRIGYQGYVALAPWQTALEDRYFPYTLSWHSIAALDRACDRLLEEGLDAVVERHAGVAAYCRERAQAMGLNLYPREERFCSPTITAIRVPREKITWPELDRRLREDGLVVGGSLDRLENLVFRIGHMGTQADRELVERGMDVLEEAISEL